MLCLLLACEYFFHFILIYRVKFQKTLDNPRLKKVNSELTTIDSTIFSFPFPIPQFPFHNFYWSIAIRTLLFLFLTPDSAFLILCFLSILSFIEAGIF